MNQPAKMPRNWKGTQTLEQARELIDFGVMLKWRDMRTLRRELDEASEAEAIRHFARRFVERASVRLQAEITVESMMIWLANAASEKLLHTFLEEFFAQPGCDEACWALVEIALTSELSETSHGDVIFEMAVAMICELGLSLQEYNKAYPNEFNKAQQLLDYIATYLLSVSNANSISIRLSLLHYFGVYEHAAQQKHYMNRIMGRFGHTVLDHLFTLLFRKRSEAVALQYLIENLPFLLEADHLAQKIVHETFKTYMLKQPERFCLFIQAFSDELVDSEDPTYDQARRVFLQHLGAMLRVVSEVNHKQLARELFFAILKFDGFPYFGDIVKTIREDSEIRKPMIQYLEQLVVEVAGEGATLERVAHFRAARRGRKPAFNRAEGLGTMNQVAYLGAIEIPKAS